jgi:hypothetical protein
MKNLRTRRLLGALLVALVTCGASILASAAVFVSVNIAPPPLIVYEQPPAPAPGYIWTPGYWAYGDDGYYWVPGTWVLAPFVGALWTPGYWGWYDDRFVWYDGYWGPHVGFYGGIDYGFGYFGVGYLGGRWDHGTFVYNTAVNNINTTIIRNTYYQPAAAIANASHTSFNGGNGGITAQPTAQDRLAERDRHRSATPAQVQHQQAARLNGAQFASVNHGTPAVTATAKPLTAEGHGAVGTQSPRSVAVAHRSLSPGATAKTATTKTATTKEHRLVGTEGSGSGHAANRAPAVTAAAKPAATKQYSAARVEAPATAHSANANTHSASRTPQATTTARVASSKATRVQEPHAASTNMASHHAPVAAATAARPATHTEHAAVETQRASRADAGNRTPRLAETTKPPPVRQPSAAATREPARSANFASAVTPGAPNAHVASAHGGSAAPPAAVGTPRAHSEIHAQAPAPSGHDNGERRQSSGS